MLNGHSIDTISSLKSCSNIPIRSLRSYYYLGETMVNDRYILCSGTTLGTTDGILAYLERGMNHAADLCDQVCLLFFTHDWICVTRFASLLLASLRV